jgi:SAM-dependent methyltransferase
VPAIIREICRGNLPHNDVVNVTAERWRLEGTASQWGEGRAEDRKPVSALEQLRAILAPYGPRLPVAELSAELNKIYHSYEAPLFNRRHPDITRQAPRYWAMMAGVVGQCRQGGWSVLDFGCGTGFEAEQVLRHLPHGRIAALTCYDPSPEMLGECRVRIEPLFPAARFTSNLEDLLSPGPAVFDTLCTNAMLHHVADVLGTIRMLQPILTPDAVWLMGHEPSARYFRNPEAMRVLAAYERDKDRHKYLQPRRYARRLKRLIDSPPHPALSAAREATRRGLFAIEPPTNVIAHLVDIGSPFAEEEGLRGRGFDLDAMQAAFGGIWKIVWRTSYSFMGTYYEGSLPRRWRQACRDLQDRFPDDGAQCCAVWQRTS